MLTVGARTRKALGGEGLEPVPVVAGGPEQFSGSARLETRFFTHYENLKKCMMAGGGKISFLYVERLIIRRSSL